MPEKMTIQPRGFEVEPAPAPPVEVEATAADTAKPEKYSDAQRQHIDGLIKEAMGRAARELRADNNRLKADLDAARRTQPATPAPGEDLTLKLAEVAAERDALRRDQETSKITTALQQAVAGESFFDSGLAADLLRSNVRLVDGKPVVIDPETGEARLNSEFKPMSLSEAARDLANRKKFLVRGEVKPGLGSSMNQYHDSGPDLLMIFGPKSDYGAARRLGISNPKLYAQLKAVAKSKGII